MHKQLTSDFWGGEKYFKSSQAGGKALQDGV